jgi:Uma2 family endonuclease
VVQRVGVVHRPSPASSSARTLLFDTWPHGRRGSFVGTAPPAGTSGLTYEDLLALPDAGSTRYELLDGELLVTPAPTIRHQRAVGRIYAALLAYTSTYGGEALVGPVDVYFADVTVFEPDVVALRHDSLDRIEAKRLVGPPDVVVEVSSPSTRRTDLVRKRRVYEREGVPEFWFVDLDADQVHVYRLGPDGVYGSPSVALPDGEVTSHVLDGFVIAAEDALALDPHG